MIHNSKFIIHQKGQAALIALLVLTIATTVGLSLIARGTTDISTSRSIEDSTRAFSAAEAGIEQALKSGSAAVFDYGTATYSVSVASVSGQANMPFIFPKKLAKEETSTFWFVAHNADGTLAIVPTYTAPSVDVCWDKGAIVATVLYKESTDASYRVAKAFYDSGTSCQTLRFSDLSASLDPAVDTLLALRLRAVNADIAITITPLQAIPVQGVTIQSQGSTKSGLNRKITVFQQFRSPGSALDHAIYSQNSFSSQ